jgi:hypothetical protein
MDEFTFDAVYAYIDANPYYFDLGYPDANESILSLKNWFLDVSKDDSYIHLEMAPRHLHK